MKGAIGVAALVSEACSIGESRTMIPFIVSGLDESPGDADGDFTSVSLSLVTTALGRMLIAWPEARIWDEKLFTSLGK